MSGRARTLKPEFLSDPSIAGMSEPARLLAIGMLLLADDYGNLRAEPAWLHAQVFWSVPSSKSIAETLAEVAESGFVALYAIKGQRFASIRNWSKHQRIDRPSGPKVPPPPADAQTDLPSDSTHARDTLASESRVDREGLALDRIGMDRNGEDRSGVDPGDAAGAPSAPKESVTRVRAAAARRTPYPDGFAVSPAIEQMCREERLANPHKILREFRDYCRANGKTYVDWEAAFRNWLRSDITRKNNRPWVEEDPAEIRRALDAEAAATRAKIAAMRPGREPPPEAGTLSLLPKAGGS